MKPSCFLLILTVCTQTLTSRKDLTQTNFPKISGQKKRPDKELIQLLEINLTRNDFEFNGDFYLQVKGTAMGKKFAPAYANIFMAEWESEALSKCVKKPLYYYRFLDDIWGIWHHSEQDFEGFLNTLNGHNASIKLKSTFHKTKIDFLDTTTFKGPNFLTDHRLDVKKCSLNPRIHMPYCLKPVFTQNIHLLGLLNHNYSVFTESARSNVILNRPPESYLRHSPLEGIVALS